MSENKVKHTPGPWVIDHSQTFTSQTAKRTHLKIDAGEDIVANTCAENKEEALCNAKLIAAAPELLEAALKASKWIFKQSDIDHEKTPWRDLVNAIKKATE